MERDSLAGQFDEVLRPYVEAAKATEVREALLDILAQTQEWTQRKVPKDVPTIAPLHCPLCERSFKRKEEFQRHGQEFHVRKKIPCHACNTKLEDSQSFRKHFKRHHKGTPMPTKRSLTVEHNQTVFCCGVCGQLHEAKEPSKARIVADGYFRHVAGHFLEGIPYLKWDHSVLFRGLLKHRLGDVWARACPREVEGQYSWSSDDTESLLKKLETQEIADKEGFARKALEQATRTVDTGTEGLVARAEEGLHHDAASLFTRSPQQYAEEDWATDHAATNPYLTSTSLATTLTQQQQQQQQQPQAPPHHHHQRQQSGHSQHHSRHSRAASLLTTPTSYSMTPSPSGHGTTVGPTSSSQQQQQQQQGGGAGTSLQSVTEMLSSPSHYRSETWSVSSSATIPTTTWPSPHDYVNMGDSIFMTPAAQQHQQQQQQPPSQHQSHHMMAAAVAAAAGLQKSISPVDDMHHHQQHHHRYGTSSSSARGGDGMPSSLHHHQPHPLYIPASGPVFDVTHISPGSLGNLAAYDHHATAAALAAYASPPTPSSNAAASMHHHQHHQQHHRGPSASAAGGGLGGSAGGGVGGSLARTGTPSSSLRSATGSLNIVTNPEMHYMRRSTTGDGRGGGGLGDAATKDY